MDSQRLLAFVTVADRSSFTAAAAQLRSTQPAISRQIQQLEEEAGTALLWRNRRTVRVTPAGAIFLEHARRLLQQMEEARRDAQRGARGDVGRLALGFLGPATYPFLPDLVRRYRSLYPGVKVSLSEMTPTAQIEALQEGLLDAGLTRLPDRQQRASFHSWVLYKDRLVAALPENYNLPNGKLPLEHLAGQPLVEFERTMAPSAFDQALATCRSAGFTPDIVHECPSMQSVLVHVSAGVGVSLVPWCVRFLGIPGVTFADFRPTGDPIDLALVWLQGGTSPTVAAFRAVLKERQVAIREQME